MEKKIYVFCLNENKGLDLFFTIAMMVIEWQIFHMICIIVYLFIVFMFVGYAKILYYLILRVACFACTYSYAHNKPIVCLFMM